MTKKAPSEGQKVDLGKEAPVRTEKAGPVPDESLAAQSASKGGEFSRNPGNDKSEKGTSGGGNAKSEAGSTTNSSDTYASHLKYGGGATSENSGRKEAPAASKPAGEKSETKADTAPTYVNNQYIRDSHGPHGKNLHEGIDYSKTEDGIQKALNAEPGSKDDPARLALGIGGGRPGMFQEGDKTAFDKLKPDAEA